MLGYSPFRPPAPARAHVGIVHPAHVAYGSAGVAASAFRAAQPPVAMAAAGAPGANDTESDSSQGSVDSAVDALLADFRAEQRPAAITEAQASAEAAAGPAGRASGGPATSAVAVGSAGSAFQPVAASATEIWVKRDGKLVRAVFTVKDRIRDVILGYAGRPGDPTYDKIMERVILPTECADPSKKELCEINVYFPDTNEGFSNAKPWVLYFSTGGDHNIARKLESQTKDITGRIEIQVPRFENDRFPPTNILLKPSEQYDWMCEQHGLEDLKARQQANARKFLRADAADAAEFMENATNPNAASAHLQSEAPAAVVGQSMTMTPKFVCNTIEQYLTGFHSRIISKEIEQAMQHTDRSCEAVRNVVNGVKNDVDGVKDDVNNLLSQLEAMKDELRKVKRPKTATVTSKKRTKTAPRMAHVQRSRTISQTALKPSAVLPKEISTLDIKTAVTQLTPPPLFLKNFKQCVKYTGNDQHIMTRRQLFDVLQSEPTLAGFEYVKNFVPSENNMISSYFMTRNLHTLMFIAAPEATLAKGDVDYDRPVIGATREEWYYVGVRSAEHLQDS